jgi:hypothetical protein
MTEISKSQMPNVQTPNRLQQPSLNSGLGNLGFLWRLGFGVWDLRAGLGGAGALND